MVHTKSVSELSTGDIAFLRSLDTQAVYDRMAKVQLGGGKCTIACNFCGSCFKNPKAITAHLLNDCPVAGLRRNGKKGRRQSGGGRKSSGGADHFYAELRRYEVLTDDQLQRKVYELCGIMVPVGTPRMTMLKILNEFARIYRKDIKKRELQMYLQRLLQEVMQHRHVLPYQGAQNGDEIARLAAEVQRLNHLLAECRSKQGECRSGIAFAEVQRGALEKETGATAGELIKLRRELEYYKSLSERLQAELKACQEELSSALAEREQVTTELETIATELPAGPLQQRVVKVVKVFKKEVGLEKKIADRKKALDDLDAQLIKTNEDLASRSSELEALVKEITEQTKRRDALQAEIASLASKKSTALTDIASLSEKEAGKSKLDAVISEKEKRAASLQGEIGRLTEQRKALETTKESRAEDINTIADLRAELAKCKEEKAAALSEIDSFKGLKEENERLRTENSDLLEAQAVAARAVADAERNLKGTLDQIRLKDEQFQNAQETMADLQSMIYWDPETITTAPVKKWKIKEFEVDVPKPDRLIDRWAFKIFGKGETTVKRPKDKLGRETGLFQKIEELQQQVAQFEKERKEIGPKMAALEDEKRKWQEEETRVKWKLAELGQQLFNVYKSYEWDPKTKRRPLDLLRDARGQTTVMPEAAVKASLTSLLTEFGDYIKWKGQQLSKMIKDCNDELKKERDAYGVLDAQRLKLEGELAECRAELGKSEEEFAASALAAIKRAEAAETQAAESVGSLRGSMGEELERVRAEVLQWKRQAEECKEREASLQAELAELQEQMRAFKAETRRMSQETESTSLLQSRIASLEAQLATAREEKTSAVANIQAQLDECRKQLPVGPVGIQEKDVQSRITQALFPKNEEIGRLNNEIGARKRELANLKDEMRRMSEGHTAALADLNSKLEGLPKDKTVKDLLRQITELEALSEKTTGIERRLSQVSKESTESLSKIKETNDRLQRANEELTEQVASLTSSKIAAEEEKENFARQVKGLKEQILGLEVDRERLERELRECKARATTLETSSAKLGRLEEELSTKTQTLATKEAELSSKLGQEAEISTLKASEAALKKEIESVRADLEIANTKAGRVESLEGQLETKVANLAALRAQLEGKESEAIGLLESQLAEVQAKLSTVQEECAAKLASLESQEMEARRSALEAERKKIIEEWKGKNEALERKYQEQARKTQEAVAAELEKLEALKVELELLRTELTKRPGVQPEQIPKPQPAVTVPSEFGLQEKIRQTEVTLASAKSRSSSLSGELGKEVAKSSDTTKITELTEELRAAKAEVERLEGDLAHAQEDLRRFLEVKEKGAPEILADYGALLKEKGDLERRLSDLESKQKAVEEKRVERREIGVQVESLERESTGLNDELAQCQEQLAGKKAELADITSKLELATADVKQIPGLRAEIEGLNSRLRSATEAQKAAEARTAELEKAKGTAFTATTRTNAELQILLSNAKQAQLTAELEAAGLDSDVKQAKAQIDSLTKQRNELQSKYDKLAADLKRAQDAERAAKSEASKLSAKLGALESKEGDVSTQQARITDLEGQIPDLKSQISSLTEERDRLGREKEEKEKETREALDKLKTATSDLASCRKDLEAAQKKCAADISRLRDEKDIAVSGLQAQLDDLNPQLEAARATEATLRAEKKGVDDTLAEVRAELASLQSQKRTADEQKENAIGELDKVNEQLAAKNARISEIEQERDDCRDELRNAMAAKEQAILDLGNLQTELTEKSGASKAELEAAKASATSEKERADRLEGEVKTASDRASRLQGQLDDIRAAKEALAGEKSEAATKASDELEAARKECASQLEAIGKTLAQRDADLAAARKAAATEKSRADGLQEDVRRLTEELSAAEGRIADLIEEKSALGTQVSDAEESHARQLEEKRGKLEALTKRAGEAERARDAALREVATLKDRVAALEQEGEKKVNKSELNAIQRKLADKKAELEAAKKECAECEEEKGKLDSEISTLKRTIKSTGTTAISTLQQWVTDVRIKLSGIPKRGKEGESDFVPGGLSQLQSKDRKKRDNEDDTVYQTERFNNALDVMEGYLNELKTCRQEHDALKRTIAGLESQVKSLKGERDSANLRAQTAEKALAALKSSSKDEIERLGASLAAKEADLETTKSRHKDTLERRQGEIDTLNGRLESINTAVRNIVGLTGTSPEGKVKNLVKEYKAKETEINNIKHALEKYTESQQDLVAMVDKIGEELRAANAKAEDFEQKFKECEAAQKEQESELTRLRDAEAEAKRKEEAAARALAEQQERAARERDAEILRLCEDDKRNLEAILRELSGFIGDAKTVTKKKWDILKKERSGDVSEFDGFLRKLEAEGNKPVPNCPDGRAAIKSQLGIARGLQGELVRMRKILDAAKKSVESLVLEELCEDKFERLNNAINNYIAERNSLATKLVSSIQERIIDLGIAIANTPQDEANRLRNLQKTRLNYLSVVANRPQEYSEGQAQKAQGVYQKVADETGAMMRTAKGALEGYTALYRSIEKYLKPGVRIPAGTDIKGLNEQFAGFCRTFDTILKKIDGLSKETGFISNERLINDFEDISGTVRVYARINDRFVRSMNEQDLSVNVLADERGNCTRNIEFKGGKQCVGEEFRKEKYENFYSVFQCSDNVHLYKGISQAVIEEHPLKCGLDQQPPKNMCILTDDSSRGLKTTIKQVFQGYSVVLQVYGFSGSGKTFTLFGSAQRNLPGIVQLAFKDPTVAANIRSLEITEITELYGQGSLSGGDYPRRVERRAAGPGVIQRVNYIDSFYKIQEQEERKAIPEIYPGVTFSDLMTVSGREGKRTMNIKTENLTHIGKAIDFINEKVTLDRRINGGIKATPNNPESSRGHLFIRFKITPKNGTPGELIVVDSGGVESVIDIIRIFFPEVPRSKAVGALPRKEQNAAVFGSLIAVQAGLGSGDSLKKVKDQTQFGKNAISELKKFKNKYSQNRVVDFVNEDSYVLIRQLKFLGEDLTERIYGDLSLGMVQLKNKLKNVNNEFLSLLNGKELSKFIQKYGLDPNQVQKDMIALKMRFDSGFRSSMAGGQINRYSGPDDEDFLLYKLKVARDIVREGFYINETLNEMKDYFRYQQREYENWKLPEDKEKIWNNLNGDFPHDGKRYNEFDVFYMPHFKGENIDKWWVQGKSKGQVASYKFAYGDLRDNTGDPTGMLSMLDKIAKEGEKRQKPSKFVLLALVRPDLEIEVGDKYEETTKYCIGAKAALQFAAKIASTRKITEA